MKLKTKKSPRRGFSLTRCLMRITLSWLVLSFAVVLILRFLPPPTSAFMMAYRFDRGIAAQWHWVDQAKISPHLLMAVIAAEDQKFPHHHGFDFDAIQDALSENQDGSRLRGASTITQQTAKNLFLWNGRSFVRKGFEAYFTVVLELCWPKQRILEVYLNIAEFGDGIYGAEMASLYYFGQSAARLSSYQAASLAAVLPNPKGYQSNRTSSYLQQRIAWIQEQTHQLGDLAYLRKLK